jgi:hypothetical protein
MPHVWNDPQTLNYVFAALGGVALAAACGLRAFLPLLALAIGARAGLLHLAPQASFLGSQPVLIMLAIAATIEVLADKVPVIDHMLDVAGTFVRPAAAAFAGWATFAGLPAPLSAAAAIILGAGALGVHALKAKTRLGSTALTLGHANPLLSVTEDTMAGGLSAMALLMPVFAFGLVAITVFLLVRMVRRR